MYFYKTFLLLILSLSIGFLGCTTDKKGEVSKQEQV
jgi:hypothetical protein